MIINHFTDQHQQVIENFYFFIIILHIINNEKKNFSFSIYKVLFFLRKILYREIKHNGNDFI